MVDYGMAVPVLSGAVRPGWLGSVTAVSVGSRRVRLGKSWYVSARRSWLGLLRSVTASHGVAVEEWSVMLSFRVEWQGGLGPVGSGTISRGEFSHGGSGLLRLVKSAFGWAC
jgi:hypothetical protein